MGGGEDDGVQMTILHGSFVFQIIGTCCFPPFNLDVTIPCI